MLMLWESLATQQFEGLGNYSFHHLLVHLIAQPSEFTSFVVLDFDYEFIL